MDLIACRHSLVLKLATSSEAFNHTMSTRITLDSPDFPYFAQTYILVLHLLNYVELPPTSDRTVQKGIKYNLAGLVSRRGDMRLN